MKTMMIMMYSLLITICILSGCANTGKVPGSECQEKCYYARLDCLDSCQSNMAHVTYGWKKSDGGYVSGIVNCSDRCETQYKKCMDICKNE